MDNRSKRSPKVGRFLLTACKCADLIESIRRIEPTKGIEPEAGSGQRVYHTPVIEHLRRLLLLKNEEDEKPELPGENAF